MKLLILLILTTSFCGASLRHRITLLRRYAKLQLGTEEDRRALIDLESSSQYHLAVAGGCEAFSQLREASPHPLP
jgi:hypothetical protein